MRLRSNKRYEISKIFVYRLYLRKKARHWTSNRLRIVLIEFNLNFGFYNLIYYIKPFECVLYAIGYGLITVKNYSPRRVPWGKSFYIITMCVQGVCIVYSLIKICMCLYIYTLLSSSSCLPAAGHELVTLGGCVSSGVPFYIYYRLHVRFLILSFSFTLTLSLCLFLLYSNLCLYSYPHRVEIVPLLHIRIHVTRVRFAR